MTMTTYTPEQADVLDWMTEEDGITLVHAGAGCGKTYESIQLLNGEKKCDCKTCQNNVNKKCEKSRKKSEKYMDIIKHKNIFIYLTKVHSAKHVIYTEFKEQYNRGDLKNLIIDRPMKNDNIIDTRHSCQITIPANLNEEVFCTAILARISPRNAN